MFIHYKTVISFDPYEELQAMEKFEAEHSDWKRDATTLWVTFTKESMIQVHGYPITLKGEE